MVNFNNINIKECVVQYKENSYRIMLIPNIMGNEIKGYMQSVNGGHIMCVTKKYQSLDELIRLLDNDEQFVNNIVEDYKLQAFVLEENIVNLYR